MGRLALSGVEEQVAEKEEARAQTCGQREVGPWRWMWNFSLVDGSSWIVDVDVVSVMSLGLFFLCLLDEDSLLVQRQKGDRREEWVGQEKRGGQKMALVDGQGLFKGEHQRRAGQIQRKMLPREGRAKWRWTLEERGLAQRDCLEHVSLSEKRAQRRGKMEPRMPSWLVESQLERRRGIDGRAGVPGMDKRSLGFMRLGFSSIVQQACLREHALDQFNCNSRQGLGHILQTSLLECPPRLCLGSSQTVCLDQCRHLSCAH